jgi:hypothetical protein
MTQELLRPCETLPIVTAVDNQRGVNAIGAERRQRAPPPRRTTSSVLMAIGSTHFIAFPNQPQILQNPAAPGQIRAKKIKEKRLGFSWIPLAELSLFNGLS